MKLFYKRDHQKAKYSSMIMLFEKSWTPSLHSLLIIILSPFNSAYCSPSRYFWPFTCFPHFGWCLPTLLLLNFMCWAGRWKPPWCQQYGPIKLEVFHQQTTAYCSKGLPTFTQIVKVASPFPIQDSDSFIKHHHDKGCHHNHLDQEHILQAQTATSSGAPMASLSQLHPPRCNLLPLSKYQLS